jgi:hypothetical protein
MAKQTKAEKTAADIAAFRQQTEEGKRKPLTQTGTENATISKYHRRKTRWLDRHPEYKKALLTEEDSLSTEDVKTETTPNTDAQ